MCSNKMVHIRCQISIYIKKSWDGYQQVPRECCHDVSNIKNQINNVQNVKSFLFQNEITNKFIKFLTRFKQVQVFQCQSYYITHEETINKK